MKTYGFGIVGCGMISDFHSAAIADIKNGKLVAVSSRKAENSQRLVDRYSIQAYSDYNEMLNRDDIDIVCVCTPSGAHMEPAVAAAEAGKHVIIEKPLEITLERCDAIIESCEKANVRLCAIFNSRFSDASQLVKDTVSSGRLGQLTLGDAYVKWYRSQDYYDSGDWRGTMELDGGGALMNQSIHAIDFLQYVMGPVESIQAFTDTLAHKRIDVEDVAVAALRFKNGALGVVEGTTAVYPGSLKKFEFSGTKGTIVLEEEDIITWEFEEEEPEDAEIKKQFTEKKSGGGGASDPRAINHDNHRRQMINLIQSIENNIPHLVDGREGRKAVEIILAIYQSSKAGKTVHLPL
ncbi:oxidoreductase [Candidatus Poribacteria bacterium]|jgi:predicted dehydrogenase|nr:oxidoreductase [Candidatus Poribacteria bacterium]MEC7867056.1 Gfo/Idh/MocA family oxidoreductase [Candidatus Poribacteria bacterium]|tara:strand:+ start:101 stop:1150 length:1050 start_codon:yes stop_codon:yes gene_type:complete